MPRAVIALIVILLIVLGVLFLLSKQAGEVPTKTIEVEVNQPANAH
jgi:hypothetical protein